MDTTPRATTETESEIETKPEIKYPHKPNSEQQANTNSTIPKPIKLNNPTQPNSKPTPIAQSPSLTN